MKPNSTIDSYTSILKVKKKFEFFLAFYSVNSPFVASATCVSSTFSTVSCTVSPEVNTVSPVTCSFSSSLCNKRDLNCLVALGASKILSSLLSILVSSFSNDFLSLIDLLNCIYYSNYLVPSSILN